MNNQANKVSARDGVRPSWAASDLKLACLWATFRSIHVVGILILLFAVLQTVILQGVCDSGMNTSNSLEHQGLPYLNQLGDLREQLALFRLSSYEYLFARDIQRNSIQKQTETFEIHHELHTIIAALPTGEGRLLATNLETAFDDLHHEFDHVHRLMDSDFSGAMRKLDQDIPPRIETVLAAANALESYGYRQQKNPRVRTRTGTAKVLDHCDDRQCYA